MILEIDKIPGSTKLYDSTIQTPEIPWTDYVGEVAFSLQRQLGTARACLPFGDLRIDIQPWPRSINLAEEKYNLEHAGKFNYLVKPVVYIRNLIWI